ncbi:unnamed protein product [Colias eurytheme]|nr:unnamed protein product [Colias eurytheme]
MFSIICVLTVFAAEVLTSEFDLLDQDYYDLNNAEAIFEQFNRKFNKDNENDKSDYRFEVFKQNLAKINELNEKSNVKSYGITQFTDLTFKEFSDYYLGIRGNITYENAVKYVPSGLKGPDSLDYRKIGYVTEIKDQKRCGSCYAFSSIGNIEGQYAKVHNTKAISLSEQQIVDCDRTSHGCYGGWPHNVFNSLAAEGGSMREEEYPYAGVQGQCRVDGSRIAARVTGGQQLQISDEAGLKDALVQYGPLSVVIGVNREFMLLRGKSVFKPMTSCQEGPHAVLLIGYGNDGIDDYWLLKNSWGTTWGDQGYYRMVMGQHACNIGDYAASATVE